jgi:O-antigen/teichoic acid export membrane protein
VASGIAWKKFRSDVLAALIGRWGVMAVGFITTMLLTRILTVADVGVYFMVVSAVLILGPVANLGLQEPTVRALASFVTDGNYARARAVAGSSLRVAIASACLFSIAALLVWTGLCKSAVFLSEDNLRTGIFLAVWMAMVAVEIQIVGTFQGLEKIRLAVLFDGALAKLLAMAAIAVLFVSSGHAELHAILLICVASELMNVVIAAFCLAPLLRSYCRPASGVSPSELLKTGRPFLLHQLAALVSTQGDAVVLGLFRPPAEVAQFGTAMRLSSLLSLPAAAANVPLAPSIARMQAQRKSAELEKMLQMSATGSTAVAVFLTLLLAVFGELILDRFFGAAYGAGATALAILCLGQCIDLGLGQCMLALAMSGEQAVAARIVVVGSVIKLLLAIALAHLFGAIGVAIAAAAFATWVKLAAWRAARHRLNIDTRMRPAFIGAGLKYLFRSLNAYVQRQ